MQARNIAMALAVILVVSLLLLVVAGATMLGMMGGGMMGGLVGGPGCCGFAPFGGIVLLSVGAMMAAGLIALVVWLARQRRPVESGSTRAHDILRERYARGEISREQYDQMRSDQWRSTSSSGVEAMCQ